MTPSSHLRPLLSSLCESAALRPLISAWDGRQEQLWQLHPTGRVWPHCNLGYAALRYLESSRTPSTQSGVQDSCGQPFVSEGIYFTPPPLPTLNFWFIDGLLRRSDFMGNITHNSSAWI